CSQKNHNLLFHASSLSLSLTILLLLLSYEDVSPRSPALNWREKNPITTITLLQLSYLYLGSSPHLFVEFWRQFSLFFPCIYATSPFLNLYLTDAMFYPIFQEL
ncbi:hypothetical protein GIB67_019659, partial [Kingdonia uniflora]